ncbi:MAG: thiolase family protein [Gemmatimonadetes bacterium]|nr:thiolase family protein [Gemmatimonadota bacterium]
MSNPGVAIIGVGQTVVGEHWGRSLRDLAVDALLSAIRDAGSPRIASLFVGNMMAGELTGQAHLGALVADFAGLRGIEAVRVEAACGSGAAALRLGCMAVGSGAADVVAVVGVEKMTDRPAAEVTASLAMAADGDYEARQGLSFVALNALLMRRYMHEHGVRREEFAPFCINAHRNAVGNAHAMFPFPISADDFSRARMIADPVSLLDSSPVCDGAAAVILASVDTARALGRRAVRVRASAVGTDTIALHDRGDLLELRGAVTSAARAYEQAGVKPADIDFFEVHDAFTILSVLSLEASGFAKRGEAVRLGLDDEIGLDGRIPITTMGGLKARGHPVGATGMYQLVEATLQLRGEAGANQVRNAELGMTQNIGGSGATVVTTILEAVA